MMRLPIIETDSELLQRTRAGSGAAFAKFYGRYAELVLAYLARRTPSPDIAADLTMEVFAAALQSTRRPSSGLPESPRAGLFGIARNVLSDRYRRGRVDATVRTRLRTRMVVLEDDDLQRINELTDEGRVLSLLEQLPEVQRDAVIAYVVQERSHSEVAALMGCSDLVVRKRVSRGLQTLRGALRHAGIS
jgi:RNA polymerase sigma-70 factor (ECF subfamily)